jgi:tetratricopeptide (TPR) repeat protein
MSTRKKVYLHYGESGGSLSDPFTATAWVSNSSGVMDILNDFVHNLKADLGIELKSSRLDLVHEDGDLICSDTVVYDLLNNKDDLFVVDTKRPPSPIQKATPKPSEAAKLTKVEPISSSVSVAHRIKELQDKVSKKKFKAAREICEDILLQAPNNTTVLEYLAHISYASGNYNRAIACAERICQLEGNPGANSRHLGVYLVMAQAHRENQDFEDAIEKAIECLQILEKGSGSSDAHTLELDLNAELTRSLFLIGRHGDAGNRINAVMTNSSYVARGLDAQSHVGCLMAYAEIAFQYDKVNMPCPKLLA